MLPGRCLCHWKISILIFAMLRICALSVHFFTLPEKYVLQCKNCTALVMFGRILEQCIFYIGIVKRCETYSPISPSSALLSCPQLLHMFRDTRVAQRLMTQSMIIFALTQDALEKIHLSLARTHEHESVCHGSRASLRRHRCRSNAELL